MIKSFIVIALVSSLIFLGFVMIVNIGSTEWIEQGDGSLFLRILTKQFFSLILGTLCCCFFLKVPLEKLNFLIPILFYITLALLILVFVPHIGIQVKGAHRWINLGFLHFQPSELLKLTMPLFFIHKLRQGPIDKTFMKFIKSQSVFILSIFLVILEPDNGTAALLLVTLVALYFLISVRLRYYLIPMGLVLVCAAVFASRMTHVQERIDIFLHPEKDLFGKGHQPYQAKIATASGGLFGVGLGQSLQKLNFLPEARSDYIAAIYSEEFGFFGVMVLVILYMSLFSCCFCISLDCHDYFDAAIVMIYTFLIALGAFINLGVV